MKLASEITLFFVFLLLLSSCQSVIHNTPTYPSSPQAFDHPADPQLGVYRGVITGNHITGSFSIYLVNPIDDNTTDYYICDLQYNGAKNRIIGTESKAVNNEYIYSFKNETFQLTMQVDSNGIINQNFAYTRLKVSGEYKEIAIDILKETPEFLVKTYEGIYKITKDDSNEITEGIWNIVANDKTFKGHYSGTTVSNDGSDAHEGLLKGSVNSNTLTIDETQVFPGSGIISADRTSGNFTIGIAKKGFWNCLRKM